MGAGGDIGGFAGKLRLGRGKQMGVATSRFGQVLVSERGLRRRDRIGRDIGEEARNVRAWVLAGRDENTWAP